MGSVLSWAANTVLFVVGCFLAADTFNEVAAFLLTPPPEAALEQSAAPPVRARTWAERQPILSRNLFNSSTINPAPPPEPPPAELEESKLPLKLIGTFASPDPSLARAALEEEGRRETLVVGIGQQVLNGKASVIRIERRRVVLSEDGVARVLSLEEGDETAARVHPARPDRTARNSRGPRRAARARQRNALPDLRELDEGRFELSREDVENALDNPTNLLTQARIMPKFDEGRMVGLEVSAIKEGSVFADMGIEEGDVITEFNGIAIDSPDQGVKILQELTRSSAGEIPIGVESASGEQKTMTLVVPDE